MIDGPFRPLNWRERQDAGTEPHPDMALRGNGAGAELVLPTGAALEATRRHLLRALDELEVVDRLIPGALTPAIRDARDVLSWLKTR